MRISIVLLSVLLASCATVSNPAEQLSIGMSIADAEKVLGPAESAEVTGYGQCKIYRYRADYSSTPSIAVKYESDKVSAFGRKACSVGS